MMYPVPSDDSDDEEVRGNTADLIAVAASDDAVDEQDEEPSFQSNTR